jgi:hypothetical protein
MLLVMLTRAFLSQINPVHVTPFYFSNTYFNIMFLLAYKSHGGVGLNLLVSTLYIIHAVAANIPRSVEKVRHNDVTIV